ncbi:YWFCY domain-containing protein [Mucilaginibacter sp. P25]|uniref:YWFCY domain-containing protein n=1 Tax=Mucilaginibacter sp. P25 TaxID=3423945 RepID=UPI003D7BDF09
MEETREQQRLHGFLQCLIYVSIALEFCVFVYPQAPFWGILAHALDKISQIPIYQQLLYSKLSTLLLICLVSVGTLAKKQTDLNPKSQILYPLAIGLLLFFGSTICYNRDSADAFGHTSWFNLIYMAASLTGAIMISLSCDNISKFIRTGLGKDKWNVEGESFMQPLKPVETPYSVNIPMQFYYNKKVHNGYIPIANPFKGVLLIGVPGSGKSFGIVCPYLRQIIAKEFCVCLYDYKYPDLGKVAYYHYLLAKQHGKCLKHSFHVINLTDPERSRRINPWRSDYLQSLADASESAEGLVEAMKKVINQAAATSFLRNRPSTFCLPAFTFSVSTRPVSFRACRMCYRF